MRAGLSKPRFLELRTARFAQGAEDSEENPFINLDVFHLSRISMLIFFQMRPIIRKISRQHALKPL
ncbi:MAG: hypothetical protein EA399_01695 [Desulfovibrionales bacterium]|nr:MAG: hypothetical protein EA399_01695 [Desulfovibrionales bacterium]